MSLQRIILKYDPHKIYISPFSINSNLQVQQRGFQPLKCRKWNFFIFFILFQMLLWTHSRTTQILNGSKSYGPRGNMVPQQMYSGVSDRRLWHIGIPGRASPFQGTSKSAYRIKTYLPVSILDFLFLQTNFSPEISWKVSVEIGLKVAEANGDNISFSKFYRSMQHKIIEAYSEKLVMRTHLASKQAKI